MFDGQKKNKYQQMKLFFRSVEIIYPQKSFCKKHQNYWLKETEINQIVLAENAMVCIF
jgi:hypothetical protein